MKANPVFHAKCVAWFTDTLHEFTPIKSDMPCEERLMSASELRTTLRGSLSTPLLLCDNRYIQLIQLILITKHRSTSQKCCYIRRTVPDPNHKIYYHKANGYRKSSGI